MYIYIYIYACTYTRAVRGGLPQRGRGRRDVADDARRSGHHILKSDSNNSNSNNSNRNNSNRNSNSNSNCTSG